MIHKVREESPSTLTCDTLGPKRDLTDSIEWIKAFLQLVTVRILIQSVVRVYLYRRKRYSRVLNAPGCKKWIDSKNRKPSMEASTLAVCSFVCLSRSYSPASLRNRVSLYAENRASNRDNWSNPGSFPTLVSTFCFTPTYNL
jgi:hypothetical protein